MTLENIKIDIKSLKIAHRYALAFFEAVKNADLNQGESRWDEILSDLELIYNSIFKNNEFKMFFLHPNISLSDKKETIESALRGKINNLSLNFLQTLLDENRFNIYETVLVLFKKEVDNLKNKQKVEVISAIELDEDIKNALKTKLDEKLKKDTVLSCIRNDEMLGGLIIKIDDKIIDLSLKTKFQALKNNI